MQLLFTTEKLRATSLFKVFKTSREQTLPTLFNGDPRRYFQRLYRINRLHPTLHSGGRQVSKDNPNVILREPGNNFCKMFPRIRRSRRFFLLNDNSLTRLIPHFILIFQLHHPPIFDNGIATTLPTTIIPTHCCVLLLCCCRVVVALLLRCCVAVVCCCVLLCCCCRVVVALLRCCCVLLCVVVLLLLFCCCVVVLLCCCVVVVLLLEINWHNHQGLNPLRGGPKNAH